MFKFAIRNVLRYKTRTILTMLVIAVSAFATVAIIGFTNGIHSHIINSYIQYQTAHIRITTKGYLDKERFMPLYDNIANITSFKNELLLDPNIKLAVPTIHFSALIAKDNTTIPIRVITFDLKDNGYDLDKKIVAGNISDTGLLIGTDLKEKLDLNLGDTPLILATTVEDSLNAIKPPITGITSFGISQFDKRTLIVDLKTAQRLLRSPDATTEIFITLNDESQTDLMVEKLSAQYPEYILESYKTQAGPLYSMMELENYILNFIAGFIMFLGSLVIINSLVASIYERMNEIGMLKALGYSNYELTKMLFFEGVVFGVVGGGIGFILGLILMHYFSVAGIDFSGGMGDSDMPVNLVVYPVMNTFSIILSFGISIIIPSLISLVPARILRNVTPLDALNSK